MVMTICRYNDLDTIPETMWTGDECQHLRKTGAFEEIAITDNTLYMVGDILWREGHTATVIEGDTGETTPAICTAPGAAWLREDVGKCAKEIVAIGGGEEFYLTGEKSTWYQAIYKGKIGWISGKYVKEI